MRPYVRREKFPGVLRISCRFEQDEALPDSFHRGVRFPTRRRPRELVLRVHFEKA